MWKEENDRRDNKQYNYKQDKIVKIIYKCAASWDEERRREGGGGGGEDWKRKTKIKQQQKPERKIF